MRVIVSGAVAWDNTEAIRRELAKLPPGTTIIHGDCDGADAIAGRVAADLGFAVERMLKNADDRARYKKLAWKGLNERMLARGAALVLVFHADYANSKGSKHMAELAQGAGVEVRFFTS